MTDIQILYDGPIVNKEDAKEAGLNKYFTGEACSNGHVDQRRISGGCVECSLIRTREWNKSNKKRKAENAKIWRDENREEISRKHKIWRHKNPEKVKSSAENWRSNNRDKCREYARSYRINHPDKVRVNVNNEMSRRKGAEGNHTKDDIDSILSTQKNRCAEPTCRVDLSDGYHVDHIMPLALGGSNWPENLQCLCPTCNLRKGAKHPLTWAAQNGRLV